MDNTNFSGFTFVEPFILFVFFRALHYPVLHMSSTSKSSAGRGAMIGMVIGGVGVLAGLVATYAQDVRAGIFFTVLLAGLSVFVWMIALRPIAQYHRVLQTGEEAEATIISLVESGSSLRVGGAIPKAGVRVELEVRPTGAPPFRTTTSTFLSIFDVTSVQPGSVVRVRFDRAHRDRVAIVDVTPPLEPFDSRVTSMHTKDDQMQLIEETLLQQSDLLATGDRGVAIVRSVRDTGILLDGANPIMEYVVEVQPTTGSSFVTTVIALVRRDAVSKYTPGETVKVAYDHARGRAMLIGHA